MFTNCKTQYCYYNNYSQINLQTQHNFNQGFLSKIYLEGQMTTINSQNNFEKEVSI